MQMSIGHGAYANLIASDDTALLYSYCCYTLNAWEQKSTKRDLDGELYIDRACLVEPEIRERIKRMPSGREKRITTRIVRSDYSIQSFIRCGMICVKNAGGTWMTDEDGIDHMALSLLDMLFIACQQTGEIPEHVGFYK